MNDTEILLQAIRNGILLGANTFADVELDEILSSRHNPAFERRWLRLFEQVKDVDLSPGGTRNLSHLREAAFKAAFKYCSDPDLSGYISDDFEVVAKEAAVNLEDGFLTGLLETYAAGEIPHRTTVESSRSLRSLFDALRQPQ